MTTGLLQQLRDRYGTVQERSRIFGRLMQYAFQRHPDIYGPDRFKTEWKWTEWPDREAHGYGHDAGVDLVAEQIKVGGEGLRGARG